MCVCVFATAITVVDTCPDAVVPVVTTNLTVTVIVDLVNVPPVYNGLATVPVYDNLDWARNQPFYTIPWYAVAIAYPLIL